MLMDTELDTTQQDYVRTAQGSGKALVSLINEVLDQAKIESGKLELEAVRFDVRAIMDDVLSLFSGKSQDKGIEVGIHLFPSFDFCCPSFHLRSLCPNTFGLILGHRIPINILERAVSCVHLRSGS